MGATNAKECTDKWRSKLIDYLSEKKYPESFSPIRYYDEEEDNEFVFLTNSKHLSALDVANLYKKRWLVELFFKWFKQHRKIKRFWGTPENAVRIQISVAIITYFLVAISSNMICNWNAQLMKFCRFLASHWRIKFTCETYFW